MKKLLALAFALLFVGQASAQTLNNLPPNTIVGRLGAGTSGPAQAIPFASLAPFLPITIGAPVAGFTTGNCLSVNGSLLGQSACAVLGSTQAFTGNNSFSGTSTYAGSLSVKIRSSATSTITVSATTDYFLCLDPTSNAITVNLPATPATGLTYLVKDCTGKAGTNNITIAPAGGNIDGVSNFVMSTNFQSVSVTYTGLQWSLN